MTTTLKAPFPYFGGKRAIAPRVWEWLGDVGGYVEPFAGSAAVLLARPQFSGRRVETLNDRDGYIVNAWRAIKHDPEAVAHHCNDPVSEIDITARAAWLAPRGEEFATRLMGDPEYYDPKTAGWWIYTMSGSIGNLLARGGPWIQKPDENGVMRLTKRTTPTTPGVARQQPHLSNTGQGISRGIPYMKSAGQGVHRKRPHLANTGKGIKRDTPLIQYLHALADRLSDVRVTCGDFERVLSPVVVEATATNSDCGVFLDPPYENVSQSYTHHGEEISARARQWCMTANPAYRIVLCGYDDEHDELLAHGWKKHAGLASGGAGFKKDMGKGAASARERVWTSPACLSDHGLLEGLI